MKKDPSIRVQAVLYNNEPGPVLKSLNSIANAVRYQNEKYGNIGRVSVEYGDASETPVFDETRIAAIQEEFSEYLDLSYRSFGFNTGYGRGHNIMGLDRDEDFLLIMNPDIICCPDFFAEMLYPFGDDLTGLVEARQTPIEHQKEYDPSTLETDWATGACFLIPGRLFKELGGFDAETFFMYCEDVDLSWRLKSLGYKLIYQPLAPVFHAKRLSDDGKWDSAWSEEYYSVLSAMLLAHKWSNDLRVEKLLRTYRNSSKKAFREAAEEFMRMKNENRLPAQTDPEHRISRFEGEYYSPNRYIV